MVLPSALAFIHLSVIVFVSLMFESAFVAVLLVFHPRNEYPSVLSGVVGTPFVGWFLALYVMVLVVIVSPFVSVP